MPETYRNTMETMGRNEDDRIKEQNMIREGDKELPHIEGQHQKEKEGPYHHDHHRCLQNVRS